MKYSVVAFFAGLAAAYHQPVGEPVGNPITAPLVQTIPAGKPFTITWTPTEPIAHKISLLLLKGPSTNVVFNQVIVEGIDNTGSFTWTPPTSIEGTDGPGGYGIQLIDDETGAYQYSTQFGISNEKPEEPATSAAPTPSETYAPAPKPTVSASGYPVVSPSPSAVELPSPIPESSDCTTYTTVYAPAPPVGTGVSSGLPPTVIYPTGAVTVPESLKTSATGGYQIPTQTPITEFPGAASGLKAGLGLAGAVAAIVAML